MVVDYYSSITYERLVFKIVNCQLAYSKISWIIIILSKSILNIIPKFLCHEPQTFENILLHYSNTTI